MLSHYFQNPYFTTNICESFKNINIDYFLMFNKYGW